MQIHNRPLTRTFTLCGFWEGKEAAAAQEIAVSRKWADEIAPVETIPFYETDGKDYSGYLNPGFDFSNSWNIEKKVEKLTERCGFDPAKVNDGVNWAYGFASVDAGTALLIAAVLLLILVSGYLIIYNIFYLNVFGDIRFYGLLKTIGATGKQLKNIVYRQAWTLCVVGIPIGLLAGWLIGRVLTLVIMSMLTVGETYYSANPLIFIGSAIFAWFTVWLSCRKPCRMAAKVSPVEAVKYTESGRGIRKKKKKTKRNSLFAMASANLSRNPKKTILVICSCALSMILLNSVYTIVTGFDMDQYISNYMMTDFSVTDATIGAYTGRASVYDGVTEEVEQELLAQKGITDIGKIYFLSEKHQASEKEWATIEKIMEKKEYREYFERSTLQDAFSQIRKDRILDVNLYGVNEFVFEKLHVQSGNMDWKAFETGTYILVNAFGDMVDEGVKSTPFAQVNDQVTLELPDGSSKEYTVLAVAELPYALGARMSCLMGMEYILPETEIQRITGGQRPLRMVCNTEKSSQKAVEQWLEEYTQTVNPDIAFESKETYVKEFQNLQRVYVIAGGFLSGILALIGILNFVNVMVTSILSRRQELAMMESIGMTGKQQTRMLQYEGLAYALWTAVITCTIGIAVGYVIVQLVAGQAWIFTWHFTMVPILVCLPVLFAISLIVPVVCYRKICGKQSIVEQLRVVE